MTDVLRLRSREVEPTSQEVMRELGIPEDRGPSARVEALLAEIRTRAAALWAPVAVMRDVSAEEFASIYEGEGRNEPEAPLAAIFPRARSLSLFAVTLGAAVSEEIDRLFGEEDAPSAYLLDAVASAAAEKAVQRLRSHHRDRHTQIADEDRTYGVLAYSPGYCGWDITGQRRLFAVLRPERIGILLGPSCLMRPLKSVSGVLVGGAAEIHDFPDDFAFCELCDTKACRERIATVYEQAHT
jgi:hypothetical protein